MDIFELDVKKRVMEKLARLARVDYSKLPQQSLDIMLNEAPRTFDYVAQLRADPNTDPELLKSEESMLPRLMAQYIDARRYADSLNNKNKKTKPIAPKINQEQLFRGIIPNIH